MTVTGNQTKILRKAYFFGAEANENSYSFAEYIEDFCIFLGVEKWSEVDIEIRNNIKKEFRKGKIANKKNIWS